MKDIDIIKLKLNIYKDIKECMQFDYTTMDRQLNFKLLNDLIDRYEFLLASEKEE